MLSEEEYKKLGKAVVGAYTSKDHFPEMMTVLVSGLIVGEDNERVSFYVEGGLIPVASWEISELEKIAAVEEFRKRRKEEEG